MKKVNFLIGAGASSGVAPSTSSLTTSLLAWTRYMPTESGLEWNTAFSQTDYTGGAQTRYYQAIKDWIAPHLDSADEFLHFERLIYISSQLDSFTTERALDRDGRAKSLLRPLFDVRGSVRGFDNANIHSGMTELACSHILHLVASALIGRLGDLLNLPINNFLRELANTPEIRINLFSLNYDTIPAHSGLEFEDGFSLLQDDVRYLHLPSLVDSDDKHLFIQLHGSCYFGYRGSGGPGRHLVVRLPNEEEARDNRLNTASMGTWNQDGSQNPHALMITGMRKADFLLDEPFSSYFHKFRSEAFKSPVFAIVGYGGGDRHVNETIQSAIEYWKAKGQRMKILWIGYAPDSCFENGEATWDTSTDILQLCGESIGQTFGPDVARYLGRPPSLWRIKRNEVQKFSIEIADLLFSFRGTDATFTDHLTEVLEFVAD